MTKADLLLIKSGSNITNIDRLKQCLVDLKEGKYVLSIRKVRKKRSLPQNAYYHGVVVKALAEQSGYDTTELHEHLKYRYLRTEKPIRVKSTKELSTIEFGEYLDKCIRLCAELGLYIMSPEEYYATPEAEEGQYV